MKNFSSLNEKILINHQDAIDILSNNKILLVKTDTIFGLLCDAQSQDAIKKIYEIKERDESKTCAIFIHPNQIGDYIHQQNNRNLKLFEKFTPGPVTFVIKNINKNLTHLEKNGKIGIRIPNDSNLLSLLAKYKKPLIATSANISGYENPISFSEIDQKILDHAEIFFFNLENSILESNLASSVFDISSEEIIVLRKGAIGIDEIVNYKY